PRRPLPAAPPGGALGRAGHAHRRAGPLQRAADDADDPCRGLGRDPGRPRTMSDPAPQPAGPVTDTHLHLWDLAASPYAWLAGAPAALRRTVRFDEASKDLLALGVTRVVLVQADDTAQDTAHLQRTAREIEGQGGITRVDVVGWLPLRDPAAVAAALADPART